jgi:hypothetical protein
MDSDDVVASCHDRNLYLNDMKIGPKDFVELVMYYMKNTDVELNDHRYELKERIELLILVEGFNGPRSRRFVNG